MPHILSQVTCRAHLGTDYSTTKSSPSVKHNTLFSTIVYLTDVPLYVNNRCGLFTMNGVCIDKTPSDRLI